MDSLERILPAERIPQLQEAALLRAPRGRGLAVEPRGLGPRSPRRLGRVGESERSLSGTARRARGLRPEGTQVGE